MSSEHQDALRRHRVDIVEDLEPKGAVLDSLYEDGVLTENDLEFVASARTRKERVQSLLSIIPTRGPVAYGSFQKALQNGEYYNLAKLLVPAQLDNRHHVQPDKPLISGSCPPCLKFSEQFENNGKIKNTNLINLLRWQCCLFLDNIEPRDVIDQFFQDHMIDMYDIDLVISRATRRQRCEVLFDILLQNPDTEVVESLKRALMKKYRYIVEEIVSSGVEKTTSEKSKQEIEPESYCSFPKDKGKKWHEKFAERKPDVIPLIPSRVRNDKTSNTVETTVASDRKESNSSFDDSGEYTKLSFGSLNESRTGHGKDSALYERNDLHSDLSDYDSYAKLSFGSLNMSHIDKQAKCIVKFGQQNDIAKDVCALDQAEELNINSLLTNRELEADKDQTIAARSRNPSSIGLSKHASSEIDDVHLNKRKFDKLQHNSWREMELKSFSMHVDSDNKAIGKDNAQRDLIHPGVNTNTDSDFFTMTISKTESTHLKQVETIPDKVNKDADELFIAESKIQAYDNVIESDSAVVDANKCEENVGTNFDCVDGCIVEPCSKFVGTAQIIKEHKSETIKAIGGVTDVFNFDCHMTGDKTSQSKRQYRHQEASKEFIESQPDNNPNKEMLPMSVTSTQTERLRKRLAVAFNYLSTLINQGEFDKFEDVSGKLQNQFPCNFDLRCIIGYLQTSRDLFHSNFDSAKKNINATLALVPKTSNPRYFTLEIFTAKTRMYITRKKLTKLQTALDEAMMILETDPVGCTGRATGWLCINHARNKTAQLTCLNLSKPAAMATYENLFQQAKSCFQRSMNNFKRDGGKDGPFGFGYALCRLVVLLLRCGDNGLTMDVLTPSEDDVYSAGRYIEHLENSEIAISKILEMHFRLAKCDYQFRRHNYTRALEHAQIAFDIASDMNLLEFKEHAHNRVSNLRSKTTKILQAHELTEKETEDILFGPSTDHDDSDDNN